jgi:site-specific recombinase XerD
MTLIAATLESFFTERLIRQRQASGHTIAAYRDTLRLLLEFMMRRTGKPPARLGWEDFDADVIAAFLDYLQTERGNSARTRNARLTAIRSLFTYASLRHPEHAAVFARVLAIPPKKFDKATVSFLTPPEVSALLAAPNRQMWEGRRDHALLFVTIQTGLRVSEVIGLNCADINTGVPGAHVRCTGKGRKERSVPLTREAVAIVAVWLKERRGQPDEPAFPTRTGRRLSRDAIEHRLATHTAVAASQCPSLKGKNMSPHVLRHTAAMDLLHAGVDTTVIALWLGHVDVRSTNAYLHADLSIKERALALTTPTQSPPGRYRPTDPLLAFLEAL